MTTQISFSTELLAALANTPHVTLRTQCMSRKGKQNLSLC